MVRNPGRARPSRSLRGGSQVRPWQVCLLVAMLVPAALAQAVTFSARVDKNQVTTGDRITLTVTLEASLQTLPPVEIPALAGVEIYTGGTSQGFSFINGQTSASATTTYYLVVRTQQSFTIPALEIEVEGKKYRTQPIPVQVRAPAPGSGEDTGMPGSSAPPPGTSRSSPSRTAGDDRSGSRTGGRPGDDVFITLEVDRTKAFVGEQIALTFRFHRRVQLWDSPKYTPPKTEGFWREDMPPERNYRQNIAGYRYNVTELRYALFPARPGELTITPAQVTIPVDVFDRFFSTRRRAAGPSELSTPSITVEVLPLPAPRPADFSGIVATRLALTTAVDRTSVPRGEPISLKIDLVADGFLKSFAGFELPEPAAARMHDAIRNLDIDKSGERLVSQLHVEKVIVPTREGGLSLPPVQVAYFDPESAAYRTVSRTSEPVLVTPSDLPVVGDDASSFQRSEIERLARDLAFIHPVPGKLRTRERPWLASALWWVLALLPGVLLAGLRWWLARVNRWRRDPAGQRRRQALATARGTLKKAEKASLASEMSAALARAILTYVADRSGRQPTLIEASEVRGYAEALGLTVVGQQLVSLLDLCDGVRFGSAQVDANALGVRVREADSLLQQLERAALRASQKVGPQAGARVGLYLGILLGGAAILSADAAPARNSDPSPARSRLGPVPEQMVAEGNQAYTSGDISGALASYREALAAGVNDPVLHYNLGNAYARQGQLGRAILGYLRALRLAPRDRNVKANLEWIRSHTQDLELQLQRMPVVVALLVAAAHTLSLDEWSLVLIGVIWLTAGLVAVIWYRGGLTLGTRRLLLVCGALLVTVVAVLGWRWYEEQVREQAVVIATEVEVRSGPAASFPVVFRIHDGLTLTVTAEREGWLRIGLGGEWVGWVPESSIERVRFPQQGGPSERI